MYNSNNLSILDVLIEKGVFTAEEIIEHLSKEKAVYCTWLFESDIKQIIKEEFINVIRYMENSNYGDLLTTVELSKELDLEVSTLETWRSKNRGPNYVKEGGFVSYRGEDIVKWLENRAIGTCK